MDPQGTPHRSLTRPRSESPQVPPLAGRVVALPETRELEPFQQMLRAAGATVISCPLVGIQDAPDQEAVTAWLQAFLQGGCDDLVAYTGEGIRRLNAAAQRLGLQQAFVEALQRCRVITRGPKPARELLRLGKRPDLAAAAPTTDGLRTTLATLDLRGRRVGVQGYGSQPNETLLSFLRAAGATPLPVAPYVYASAADERRVVELLETLSAGKVSAIAFTFSGQVERMAEVAGKATPVQLQEALARTAVVAVGPVVANTLRKAGCEPTHELEHPFVWKHLFQTLVALLG